MTALKNYAILCITGITLTACNQKPDKSNQTNEDREFEKPNIVFIIADDLGWQNLGCYGSDYYQTPNIDKLAREGTMFTNAYASCTVCSPTRAAILTGKHPARLKLTNFIPGHNKTDKLLTIPDWQKYLSLEEVTIGEVFKKEGYTTALFGKWHLSKKKTPPESLSHNPDQQGFDETFVTYKPAGYMPIGEWQKSGKDPHSVDTLTNLSLDFIARNKNNPFFLIISHNTVHDPLMEDSSLIAKYAAMPGADKEENNPVLAAMIETLDKSVGRVVDKIEKSGLNKNTLIIFYSDNGGLASDAKQGPLRKGKGWLYEGGIRVPLIFSWPGIIPGNRKSDEMVISTDFRPTFQYLLGNDSMPDNTDGVNLWPMLSGENKLQRNTLYWHFPHYHAGPQSGAIRKGKYKLIEWYEGIYYDTVSHLELYDLENDLGESHNLVDEMPEKANELLKDLQEWRKNINAQMPEKNKGYSK